MVKNPARRRRIAGRVALLIGASALLVGVYLSARYFLFLVGGPEIGEPLGPIVVSPDGKRVAQMIQTSRGGATVGFFYEVVVGPTERDMERAQRNEWVWRSYGLPPDEVRWLGANVLLVRVDPTNRAYFKFIETSRRWEVTAISTVCECL